MSRVEIDLADPHVFAVDLDVRNRRVMFLRFEADVLERSVFLDNRIAAPLESATAVALDDVAHARFPGATPSFLFHTSFCCSTLLARALHVPPRAVALKEPLLPRRLADARHAGLAVTELVAPSVALLARPWAEGGRVLIKPTHAALNLAVDLLAAGPSAPALLLYGTLEDFLISNCKKPPETQAKVGPLAQRALAATRYGDRLAPDAAPQTFHQLVALQWCAQLALALEVFESPHAARLRSLRELDLLRDPDAIQAACVAHLQLPIDEAARRERLAAAVGEHAKAPGVRYDAANRTREQAMVRSMFGREIVDALAYAERHLLPALPSSVLPRPLAA